MFKTKLMKKQDDYTSTRLFKYYFPVRCDTCGWRGSSELCEFKPPDEDEMLSTYYCPVCDEGVCEEYGNTYNAPWRIYSETNDDTAPSPNIDYFQIVDFHDIDIAVIETVDSSTVDYSDYKSCVAHLIANAPDMLFLLEECAESGKLCAEDCEENPCPKHCLHFRIKTLVDSLKR